jgi:hypothetical protein
VTNQNGDPEGGWTVFLDYNNNGVQDANEPITTTNSAGFYSFTPKFTDLGPAPVALTGFNQDVVFEALANPTVSHDFDNYGFAWFQSGATDASNVTHNHGLPPSFTSKSGTPFQFQSFTNDNVLLLGPAGGLPSSGTLTLTTPASYSTLAILASSSAPNTPPTGTVTVHYTDGTTDTFTYNAPDWGSGDPSAALATPAARAQVGGGNTFQGTDPNSGDQ